MNKKIIPAIMLTALIAISCGSSTETTTSNEAPAQTPEVVIEDEVIEVPLTTEETTQEMTNVEKIVDAAETATNQKVKTVKEVVKEEVKAAEKEIDIKVSDIQKNVERTK